MRLVPPPLRLIGLLALPLALLGCADAGGGTPDAGPLPEDQCVSTADMEIILAHRVDAGAMDSGVREVVYFFETCVRNDCLEAVLGPDDPGPCIDTCVGATEVGGLSQGCRDCYTEEVFCAQQNCVLECLGSDAAACYQCVEDNCYPRLLSCVGF